MKEYKPQIAQHNDFIQKYVYTSKLTATDIKVFKTILAKVKHNNSLFEEFYEIDYSLLDIAGVQKKDRFYEVSKSLEKLMNTFVILTHEQRKAVDDPLLKKGLKGDRKLGLIANDYIFSKNTKKIIISIPKILKPFFLELSNKYTIYDLENISKLKTPSEIKLYELLASWKGKGKFFMTVENLKLALGIQDKYPQFKNFKQKILDKAIKRINENTDLMIFYSELTKYDEIKKIGSREKTEKIEFRINDKNSKYNSNLDDFIKKSFIDNEGKEFLILEFITKEVKDKKLYNLRMVDIKNGGIANLKEYMTRAELIEKILPLIKD